MGLTYTTPEIKSSNTKPLSLANKGFPYHNLSDHRRFEELVYSVYLQEIQGGIWKDLFDKINLLQGVRERGRDCILFRDNKIAGLIQCKHSINEAQRISRPECIREILKFMLHTFVDSSLLPDPANFTYYFAVSYGFSEPANTLLENFASEFSKETNIEDLAKDIIAANNALSALAFETIESELRQRLTSIKLRKILPQELDLRLNSPSNHYIISLFFEVKSVVRTEDIGPIVRNELHSFHQEISDLHVDKILEKFHLASTHLLDYSDQFDGLLDSHIKRSEVQQLLQWIIAPIVEKEDAKERELPVALLAGNAGTGKTVIFKELLNELNLKNIPVLGLKADRIYAKSIRELEEKADLGDSIDKLITKLKERFEKVVILIDQIDALSQSVSTNTEYIDTFNHLVRKLMSVEGVRIVISCRIYDLNYDSELKFYKNQTVFNVSMLDVPQVKAVLKRLDIDDSLIRGSLLELLRTPHHLNVFCKVFHGRSNFTEIRSLNDLYNELWKQKIVQIPLPSKVTNERCKKLIYAISDRMYLDQKIVVNISPFTEDYFNELEYLKSNSLIIENNKEIQFFHQTFFNFAFSKAFVDSKKTLTKYLQENHQGLHIRSSIKMIIGFLKEHDHSSYIKIFDEILLADSGLRRIRKTIISMSGMLSKFRGLRQMFFAAIASIAQKPDAHFHFSQLKSEYFQTTYRIHIKYLIIEFLSFESRITPDERKLAARIIASKKFRSIFFDSITSSSWLKFCIETGSLHKLLPATTTLDKLGASSFCKRIYGLERLVTLISSHNAKKSEDALNQCFRLLRRYLPEERGLVLSFLWDSPEHRHKAQFVTNLLFSLKMWDMDTAFRLFERYAEEAIKDKHRYYHILEDASDYNVEWVIHQYRTVALNKIALIDSPTFKPDFAYQDEQLFKKFFEKDPSGAFKFTLEIIHAITNKTAAPFHDSNAEIHTDLAFYMFDYDRRSHSHGYYAILHLLIDETQKLSKNQSQVFEQFVNTYLNSNSEAFLKLLLYGLIANPAAYYNQTFELIKILDSKMAFEREDKLQYLSRRAINVSYSFFNSMQKTWLNTLLLSLKYPRESAVYVDQGIRKHRLQHYGYRKYLYLMAVPEKEINSQPDLKKVFQELTRKFPAATDRNPNQSYGGVVGPPLEQSAYDMMDLASWENSFKKYDSEVRVEWHSLRGSLREHSRAFESAVLKRPNYFFPLVEKLANDMTIAPDYLIHGMQGLKSAKYNALELKRLFKKIILQSYDTNNTRYIIWLIDYFIDTNTMDYEMISYLCNKAINHPDPETDRINNEALITGINTVRGAAASRVPYLYQWPESKDLIFETANKILADKTISVRVSLMPRLALLMNLDQEETLKCFLKATADWIPEIMEQTPWTAHYLAHKHFSKLREYFEKALAMESIQSDIAMIIAVAWLNGKPGSAKLMRRALKSSTNAKSSIIEVSVNYLLDKNEQVRKKATLLYKKFLNDDHQEIVNRYSTSFLDLSSEDFKELFPLLKEYSKSKVAKKSPHDFFDYLLKCAKRYPKECISLLSGFNKYEKPDITQAGYYNDEDPIKVLLGAYNALRRDNKEDKIYITKSMDLFDKILLDERFRTTAQRALINVEA